MIYFIINWKILEMNPKSDYTIYTDGGARGNPGPAATGVVIKNEKGKTLASYGEYLGAQTNNYAEYSAKLFVWTPRFFPSSQSNLWSES